MREGYRVVPDVVDPGRLAKGLALINGLDRSVEGVMSHKDLFAIRDVCGLIPSLLGSIWTPALGSLVHKHVGEGAFLAKSIFFDKPAASNWFVGFHQDISISVAGRSDVDGFEHWTAKHGVVGVVPPVHYLERTLTVRIHFDDTDGTNGALRVVPKSHLKGILQGPPDTTGEVVCSVPTGGAMLMRPLLLHASRRSTSERPRRVLHLEFNDLPLPEPLDWSERRALPEAG